MWKAPIRIVTADHSRALERMTTILAIDYGLGNVGAVANMVRKAGGEVITSSEPGETAAARKLVLPGVGHFGRAMETLARSGLTSALNEAVVARGASILGLCLGMQLFCR